MAGLYRWSLSTRYVTLRQSGRDVTLLPGIDLGLEHNVQGENQLQVGVGFVITMPGPITMGGSFRGDGVVSTILA